MAEEKLVEGKDRTASEIELVKKGTGREFTAAAKMVEPFLDATLAFLEREGLVTQEELAELKVVVDAAEKGKG